MKWNPFQTFKGNCAEVFRFYERCFDGTILAMFPFVGVPSGEHMPSANSGKIMHARLVEGNQ